MKYRTEKAGAKRVAVFSFFRAKIYQSMLQKPLKIPVEKRAEDVVFCAPTSLSSSLSSNVFFGIFVSLALFLTALLYGSGREIANMDIPMPQTNVRQTMLENRVQTLVSGYPIEQMTELISQQQKTTAAFLVGIAKKESNWGKRVPRDGNGDDCFNYWGYRGAGSRGIAMGHGCFGSPEEAIRIVGGRLDTFINEYKFRTAKELVVWKCGFSCAGHSNQSVKKWISDVGYYTDKIKN